MSIEVEVTGNGKFAGHSTNLESYTVTEEATPIDPADASGQTGTIQFVATEDPDPDGSILLLNDDIRLTDTKAGETVGKVNTVAVNGIAATVTGDSRLAILNANGFVPAYKGDLEGAVLAILALAGINSGIVIADEVKNIPVAHRGGNFNYWLLLKEMCQATGLAEVSLVSGNVVVREIRGREAVTDRIGQLSWGVANVDLAQYVEVKYHNYQQVSNDLVFPYGGWTPETPIYGTSVGAGETQVINIPVNVSLTSIQQPTVQDFVARGYVGPNSVYAVTGSDNLPVLAAQWTAQGGSVTLAIGADGQSIDMTVTGASEAEYAPYQIAVSAGPSDYYSSLRIIGSGLAFDPDLMVRVPTGAPAEKTAQEVGITIDNPWVDTYVDAMSAALRAAAGYAAPRQTVSITASVINRGDNGSYAYPTFADFSDQYPTELFSDFDAEWTGQTFADFNAYQFSLVRDDFENQVFGNAAGARLPFRDAMYRIKTANITQDGVVNATAERDTIFADFNNAQGTATGWAPTGESWENTYPYPSFELPSGTVTIRTNACVRPIANNSWSQGYGTGGAGTTTTVDDARFPGGKARKTVWSTAPSSESNLQHTPNGTLSVTSGERWLMRFRVAKTWGGIPVVNRNGSGGVFVAQGSIDNGDGTLTVWRIEDAGTTTNWVPQVYVAPPLPGIGDEFLAGGAQFEKVPAGTTTPDAFPFFYYGTPDAGDFEYLATGTENNSTSIMRAKGLSGVSGGGGRLAFQSQEWADEGIDSLRIRSTGSAAESSNGAVVVGPGGGAQPSFASMGHANGDTVTIVATCRLTLPQTGTPAAQARSIRYTNSGGGNIAFAQAPNTVGVHEVRLTTTIVNAATDQLRLAHGADSTNADIWWDLLTIVPGVYDGPPFSGSTPSDPGPGYAHEWNGAPDESTSTRTTLEITSGPATFADFNARFDGYRFEDFALIPLAFNDGITPYGG